MPLSKLELGVEPDVAVSAIRNEIEEKGYRLYLLLDHQDDIEGSGAMPFPAFTILFGGPKLSSMLLGRNTELSIDLPLRISVVRKEGGCRIISRDMHSLLGDFQLANAEDVANIVNRIISGVIAGATSRFSAAKSN